jgi:hypothetical protein
MQMNGLHLVLVSVGAVLGAASTSAQSIIQSERTVTTLATNADRNGATVLTAAVTTERGAGVPGGMIRFIDDTTLGVLGWTDTAHPSVTIAPLSPGMHRIYAAYSGTADFLPAMFQPSRSDFLLHKVRALPNAAVTSSLNPSAPGDMVTLTAVIGRDGDTPQGKVSFRDGNEIIAAHMSLDRFGTASFTTSALADGLRAITVEYEGDAVHAPVVSPRFAQDVSARRIHSSQLDTR